MKEVQSDLRLLGQGRDAVKQVGQGFSSSRNAGFQLRQERAVGLDRPVASQQSQIANQWTVKQMPLGDYMECPILLLGKDACCCQFSLHNGIFDTARRLDLDEVNAPVA